MKNPILTNSAIKALPLPPGDRKQILYPSGSAHVRVTKNGARSFVVDKNTPRGRICLTLGPAGTDAMTALHADRSAKIALGLILQGYTTQAIQDELAGGEGAIPPGALTLGQTLEQYIGEQRKKLSARTVSDYRALMTRQQLADWQHRPLETIDAESVVKKFLSIDSPSRANYAFRVARLVFNYAKSIKNAQGEPVVDRNPCDVLSQRRLWHNNAERREIIELGALPAWWRAVNALTKRPKKAVREGGRFVAGTPALNSDPETVRDFFQFLLLTGLRRSEGANLKWETVDFTSKMFTIVITKNREAHTLPLSDYLYAMVRRRHAERSEQDAPSEYVFPGETGPLGEPKKLIAKVVAASGVKFSSHTLRRTFATVAESLDIPYLALKRLMNHKASDVTGKHYTVIGVERLRKPMQSITDFMLRAAGHRKPVKVAKLKPAAEVLPMRKRA